LARWRSDNWDEEEQMVEGLGIVFYGLIGQLVFGAVVFVIVLIRKLKVSTSSAPELRPHAIWASLGMFTLAMAFDIRMLSAQYISLSSSQTLAIASLSSLSLALLLAVLGKGPGRVLLSVASILVGLIWLPFILF
jgi:hypothetical protein